MAMWEIFRKESFRTTAAHRSHRIVGDLT